MSNDRYVGGSTPESGDSDPIQGDPYVGDIEYYAEPVPPKVLQDILTPSVGTGYVVFRDANGEVNEVLTGALISEGDGRFYWQPMKGDQ